MDKVKIEEYLRFGSYFLMIVGIILLLGGLKGDTYSWNAGVGLLIVACLSLLVLNSYMTVEVQKHQTDLLEEISRKMDR
jgi:hypothetical protein